MGDIHHDTSVCLLSDSEALVNKTPSVGRVDARNVLYALLFKSDQYRAIRGSKPSQKMPSDMCDSRGVTQKNAARKIVYKYHVR